MCLTLVLHQADLEVECTSLISPDSYVQVTNPYQLPACALTYAEGDRQGVSGFNVPCIVGEWQTCVIRPLGIPCFGWEPFHLVVRRSEAQAVMAEISRDLGIRPMLPRDMRWLSSPQEMEYMEVRTGFFRAGQFLALVTAELNAAKQRLLTLYTEENVYQVYRCRGEMLRATRDWTDAATAWKRHAIDGKMEACPADIGIDWHPLSPFLKISNALHESPNQLMDDTDAAQIDLVLGADHVAASCQAPRPIPVQEQVPVPGLPAQVPVPGLPAQVPVPSLPAQVPVSSLPAQVPVPGLPTQEQFPIPVFHAEQYPVRDFPAHEFHKYD